VQIGYGEKLYPFNSVLPRNIGLLKTQIHDFVDIV